MSQIKLFGSTVWTAMVGATEKEAAAGGLSALVGLLVTFLGGWDKPLQVLLTMMVLDYIFGVAAAIKNKKMDSDVMFWGGIRKATVLTVVGLSAQLDNWLQPGAPIFRTAAIYFYAGREGLSLAENWGTMGIPLPFKLKSFLQQLKDKGDGKDADAGTTKEKI
ncbi:phage holin family protein [Paenibacillus brasilensis]|uniref:Toxin secretion/phage lysis holin n=1 Tax=Paenibacillus brasilensis TaxID=128574 RepID=A0ABU0L4Z7_9BACL|nr:phage holin family protein [Paenibacillus brasilensis]MDQ0496382.1 toxin secretion/phage lysis holin [Paenibacillus brasilensis]